MRKPVLTLSAAPACLFLGLAAIALPATADVPVPCSGDQTACSALTVVQQGTDHDSGAHILLKFVTAPGKLPQTMSLTLTMAEKKSDCPAKTREVMANANPGDPRSIDGYLCKMRATWERR